MIGDRKEGRNGVKAPLDLIPLWAMHGAARVMAYGDAKYTPGNWRLAAGDGEQGVLDYVAAALRHLAAMNQHGPDALDPESGLHHLDHAITSLIFARGIGQLAEDYEGCGEETAWGTPCVDPECEDPKTCGRCNRDYTGNWCAACAL